VAVGKRVVSGDLDAEELARVALMAGTYNNVLRYAEGLTKQLEEVQAELLKLRGPRRAQAVEREHRRVAEPAGPRPRT